MRNYKISILTFLGYQVTNMKIKTKTFFSIVYFKSFKSNTTYLIRVVVYFLSQLKYEA
jgi:hypothetical protein